MKPEKKIMATMNTTPATIPTQAATAVSRLRRGGSAYAVGGGSAGGGVVVATRPVAGSEDDVVSLMT